MKKSLYRIPALLLIMLLCLTVLPFSAFAAQLTAEAAIPVSIRVTGDAPSPAESYTVRLTSVDNAPMSVPGAAYADIVITGTATGNFPEITYQTVGVYRYMISQIPGTHPRGHYDARVYDVVVTVTNAENGSGLEATVAIKLNGKKYDAAEFVNDYDPEITYQSITVYKVWSDDGKNRPESVTVSLLSRDKVLDTVILSDRNGWSHTWERIIETGESWQVRENPVPGKYRVSYSYNGNTATITNVLTTGLIQTGQLNWPIWVLGGAGVVLVVLGGAVLLKKRKRNNA